MEPDVRETRDTGNGPVEDPGMLRVAVRTAGALAAYRREPALTADEGRSAFEQAVADEVMESDRESLTCCPGDQS